MSTRKSMANKTETMGTMTRDKKPETRNQTKILILHGWSYFTDRWDPFLKLMEEEGLKPQLLEIPGLTAPIDRAWMLDDYVEWLKSKVRKEKVVLIGHSNGGRISLAFTYKYPDLVDRLILIDSAGIYHNELPVRLKRFIFKNLARVGKKLTASESARKVLHKSAGVNDYREASPLMRQTMTNLISTDLTSRLKNIIAPTLIIWGREDKVTPLSDAMLMYELIPNSRIHIIKNAHHSPQFTRPEEVCEKIIEWIQPIRPRVVERSSLRGRRARGKQVHRKELK